MALVEMASQAWGWVTDTAGNAQAAVTVTLENLDSTDATHYSDLAYSNPLTSALTTASDGTIPRYIEAGTYNMTVGGTTRRVEASQGAAELGIGFDVAAYAGYADPVQEAFDAASAAGGGEVVIPEGTWTRSTSLVWNTGVRLRGHGPASVIHYTGSGHAIQFGSGGLAVDDPWTRLSISNVKITGTSSGTSAIRVRGCTRWRIENVTIDGFTNGAGILLNGASFIGKIDGGRITHCENGISAQKVAADGTAGEGQAGNAIEICGQLELQDCDYGILIGDPTTNGDLPVSSMGVEIHGCCIEGNQIGGVWVVDGNNVNVHDNYFETNDGFDVRVGSAAGSTRTPVMFSAHHNFHNFSGASTATGYDLVRANRPDLRRNYLVSAPGSSPSVTAFNVAGSSQVTHAALHRSNYVNGLGTSITDAGDYTIQHDGDDGQPGLIVGRPTASMSVVAGRGYVVRVVPSRNMRVVKIGFVVGTAAAADDAVDVGIYSAALNRIVSKGATTGLLNSTGLKTPTITTTELTAGVPYYVALSVGTLGGSAAALAGETRVAAGGWIVFGSSAPELEGSHGNSMHPLPSTFTPAAGSIVLPSLVLLEA